MIEPAAWAPLAVGFAVGLRHALDLDHVAAVSTIATRERGVARAALTGLWWATGHTAALAAIGGAALLLGWSMPAAAARWLEGFVGLVLVGLGLSGLAALASGVRFHRHAHAHGGVLHAHLHIHRRAGAAHDHGSGPPAHDHLHRNRALHASFGVGALHGLAGSGAVVLLALAAVESTAGRWLYLAAFGGGLLAAMTVLSLALGLPARLSGRFAAGADAVRGLAGLSSVAVGLLLLLEAA